MVEISVCLPAYNEGENIASTLQEAVEVLENLSRPYEILVINDGSKDQTAAVVKKKQEEKNTIRLINHSVNLGYSAATRTALAQAKGKFIFIIDSDGQQSMHDIPKFLYCMEQGYDIAVGWKRKRYDPFMRVVMSRAYNILFRMLFGSRLHDVDCGFRCLTKETAGKITIKHEGVPVGPEMFAQALKKKMKIAEIVVNHRPRIRGKSVFLPHRLPGQIWKILKGMHALKKELQ